MHMTHPLTTTRPSGGGGWRWPAAVGLVAVLLVAATYAWQHTQVTDRQAALERAIAASDAATARTAELEDRLGALQGTADRLRAHLGDVGQRKQHLVDRLRTTEDRLAAVRTQATALLGSPLADGRYFGALELVGATQEPPRLVIDVEQFFSGDAADQAAREDGVLPPGEEHIPNDIYIRNESPQWRILQIDPATTVSLTTYPFGQVDDPATVSLERFGKLFATNRGFLPSFPYWITVRDGAVVSIEQQYIP